MKRLHFLQKTLLATAAIPLLSYTKPSSPNYHVIAIGESGGRILEALNKAKVPGKYTWIKSQHNQICNVPNLNRIEIPHPYSTDYFIRDRITEMPNEYTHEVPDWNSFCRKANQTILLTQPTCYLSMYLTPLLANWLNDQSFPFHTIAIQPFRFYSHREKDASAKTFREIGQYPGNLTAVIADSIRCRGKMNLAEAIEAVYQRTAEETVCTINRLNN